jgi:hypothetical protein
MLFEKIKLETDEQILLIVRRHWFVFFTRIIGVIVSALAPLIILVVSLEIPQSASLVSDSLIKYSDPFLFLSSAWLLLHWLTLAYIWTDQYLDLWVVTDRRIISIDQRSLFVRSVSSFRLERLQDLSITIPGFMATLLNYGSVEAQTASGDEGEFKVKGLPAPREIKALILEANDKRLQEMNRPFENL